jgi:hypothetical protein
MSIEGRDALCGSRASRVRRVLSPTLPLVSLPTTGKTHIPSYLVVEDTTTHRKPPEVRICRLRNQSAVGTRPPPTSTPH